MPVFEVQKFDSRVWKDFHQRVKNMKFCQLILMKKICPQVAATETNWFHNVSPPVKFHYSVSARRSPSRDAKSNFSLLSVDDTCS